MLRTTKAALDHYCQAVAGASRAAGTHSGWISRLIEQHGREAIVADRASLRQHAPFHETRPVLRRSLSMLTILGSPFLLTARVTVDRIASASLADPGGMSEHNAPSRDGLEDATDRALSLAKQGGRGRIVLVQSFGLERDATIERDVFVS